MEPKDYLIDPKILQQRQQALDAYQARLNEMQKIDMRQKKEELDQAKIEKMDADIFKTKIQAQKTYIDAQNALAQIQQKQAAPYIGKMPSPDGERLVAKTPITTVPINLTARPTKPISSINRYYTEKEKARQQLTQKTAAAGNWLTNALKMENRLGWALIPGLAGAGIGGLGGAIYNWGDTDYLLGDIGKGALLGSIIGAASGYGYGATKLKSMMGGKLRNPNDAFSLSKIKEMKDPIKLQQAIQAQKVQDLVEEETVKRLAQQQINAAFPPPAQTAATTAAAATTQAAPSARRLLDNFVRDLDPSIRRLRALQNITPNIDAHINQIADELIATYPNIASKQEIISYIRRNL